MAFFHSPNADITVTFTGEKDIMNRLGILSSKDQLKDAKFAARKAMKVVRLAAELNAAEFDRAWTPESVKKNITVQSAPRYARAVGGVVMRVGVLGGARQYATTKENVRKGRAGQAYRTGGDKGNPGGDTWYWRFIEFGTSKVRADDFLERALKSNIAGVESITSIELSKALDRRFKRAGRTSTSPGRQI